MTQNPIEQEGTYSLPEAQVDRFMFKLKVGYPTMDKGPGYGYEPAFQGMMHQGLEFSRGERRGAWVELILHDGRSAWVQADAVELIPK